MPERPPDPPEPPSDPDAEPEDGEAEAPLPRQQRLSEGLQLELDVLRGIFRRREEREETDDD